MARKSLAVQAGPNSAVCAKTPDAHAVSRVAALLVAGVVLIGTWANVLGYSAQLMPIDASLNTTALSFGYTAGRFAVALLFIVFASQWRCRAGAIGLLCGVGLAPVTLIICLASWAQPFPAQSVLLGTSNLLFSNAFMAGIGFLAVSTPLFIVAARIIEPRRAAALAMVGIVGECVVSSALNAVPSFDVQLAVCVASPMLAGACVYSAERIALAHGLLEETPHRDAHKRKPAMQQTQPRSTGMLASLALRDDFGSVLMIVQLAFVMVLASSLRYLSHMGPWGQFHQGYLGVTLLAGTPLLITCVIVVVLTLATFVLPRRIPTQLRCAAAIVFMFVGLLLSGAQTGLLADDVLDGCVMGCQLFARVVIWVVFMECVRQLRMEPLRVNGITCLFNVAGTASLTAFVNAGFAASDLSLALLVALLLITLLAAALPFAMGAKLDVDDAASKDEEATAQDAAQVEGLHAFAEHYKVSPREEQVLGLLLDGCTRGQIERLLGLSEGTIRTHVNAVYHKLNVHSKTEAHDLYDAWMSATSGVK